MIILNKGHISHYKKKKYLKEVSNMKNIFKEEDYNSERIEK